MSEPNADALPAWVSKRDGRLEPFDADKICQALFDAGAALGTPNAFQARELTDAILHFLKLDQAAPIPTTANIAEQVVKVVRELGQPALSQAFARHRNAADESSPKTLRGLVDFQFSIHDRPHEVVNQCLRRYSEEAIFSRDLLAAESDGLLRLVGIETPASLARCVIETPFSYEKGLDLWANLDEFSDCAGQGLVVDSPEWLSHGTAPAARTLILQWLRHLPALTGRSVVVNLNTREPPAWARPRVDGPLFADPFAADSHEPSRVLMVQLLDALLTQSVAGLRYDWHLQERDFSAEPYRVWLGRLLTKVPERTDLAFAFDRPRNPVPLAEGMDRQRPAVLAEVGVDLAALMRRAEVAADQAAFLSKLPSLARMAVSVGAQKRKYLRDRAGGTRLGRGFLLDRARFVVAPLHLDRVVREYTGGGIARAPAARAFAQEILRTLAEHVHAAGRMNQLDAVVDRLADDRLGCDDAEATPRQQLTAAGRLYASAERGTAHISVPAETDVTGDELLELLAFAWKKTDLPRVRFRRAGADVHQPQFQNF